jgi:4,5-dihydroxyphthalate decarboxylase
MSADAIRLTCADYAQVMPLATGAVQPSRFGLELLLGKRGSWPDRAEALRRSLGDDTVHGGESSMGQHLGRIGRGDRSAVALPIFVLRNFTARDLYVRRGAAIRTVADLAGKRIGMYSWSASGSIWYRHFLDYAGVAPENVQWTIGEIDTASSALNVTYPAGVAVAPPGRSLSDMLLADELDAIYSPPRPARYHPADGPIVRLFPEFRGVERQYFADTGVFPPQHLVVLRRAVWEADRSLAPALTTAFERCQDYYRDQTRSFPYASPWLEAELEETAAAMGDDPYAHGLERNRATLKIFCDMGHRLGLTEKHVTVDDYFADYMAS